MCLQELTKQSMRKLSNLCRISTPKAPRPAAPYSQAIKCNGFIFVSGQIPLTIENKLVEGSISEKSEQIIQNVKNILESSNSDLKHIVKSTVFLSNMKYLKDFNAVYSKYFQADLPARTCAAVSSLPLNAEIEMEVIAAERSDNLKV